MRDRGYEEGLLAFAFAPDYASSGRVFAYYTNNAGHLQLDEYLRTPESPNRIDAATRTPLLTIRHGQSDSHQGGQLLFGPDGYLYLSTGDGDVKGDPQGDAQNLGSLLGKILRLDVGVAGVPPGRHNRSRASGAGKRRQRVLRLRGAVAYVRCTRELLGGRGGPAAHRGACLPHAKGRDARWPGAARTPDGAPHERRQARARARRCEGGREPPCDSSCVRTTPRATELRP